jgi:GNAT superfamily N-acetyltransferase
MKQALSENLQVGSENFEIQHLRSGLPELDEKLIRTFSEAFQMVFANHPYDQFLFYPSEGKAISAQEVFQTSEAVGLDQIRDFDLNTYPSHPTTGEKAFYWMERARTFEMFRGKLKKNAFISLLRNSENDAFAGAILGYECSLEEAFEHEEWQDDKLYSTIRMPEKYRDKGDYLRKIQEEASSCFPEPESISLQTRVFCFNCIFLMPEHQGRGIGYHLIKTFLDQLPQETLDMPSIAEMVIGTTLLKRTKSNPKTKVISGVLNDPNSDNPGDRVLIISNANTFKQQLEEILQPK